MKKIKSGLLVIIILVLLIGIVISLLLLYELDDKKARAEIDILGLSAEISRMSNDLYLLEVENNDLKTKVDLYSKENDESIIELQENKNNLIQLKSDVNYETGKLVEWMKLKNILPIVSDFPTEFNEAIQVVLDWKWMDDQELKSNDYTFEDQLLSIDNYDINGDALLIYASVYRNIDSNLNQIYILGEQLINYNFLFTKEDDAWVLKSVDKGFGMW